MKRIAELVLYPILAITALIVFIYPALIAPVTVRLPLIVLGFVGIVTCCYVFHWCRYPGIYRTKSLARWLGHIGLAALSLMLSPLLAILHFTGINHALAHLVKLNKLLGLDFRFEPGERVQVRADVMASVPGGIMGSVISVRLARGVDFTSPHGAEGPILYLVQLDDGTTVEIAEQFLKEISLTARKTDS
jgi:hypothetical protein